MLAIWATRDIKAPKDLQTVLKVIKVSRAHRVFKEHRVMLMLLKFLQTQIQQLLFLIEVGIIIVLTLQA